MATYQFSSYTGSNNSVSFNPQTDVFVFDSASISPTSLGFNFTLSTASFTLGETTVTLSASPLALTPGNFSFASGGLFLIGDQLVTTESDLSTGKLSNGGSGNDVIVGLDGQDTMNGLDGNDSFFLLSANAASADTVDGGAGRDRVTFLGVNTSTGALQTVAGDINVNLATGTATQGAVTSLLTSIEQVRIVGRNGSTHTMTGSEADESFIVGGATGTSTAVYHVDGAGGSDYLAFFSSNTTAVNVNLANSSAPWGLNTVNFQNVENLSGAAGIDTLTGNAGNNAFIGNGGNDLIDGAAGIDTAIYNNAAANYSVFRITGVFTVGSSAEGNDFLRNIERLQFSDKRLAFDLGATENAGESLLFIGALAYPAVTVPSVVGLILNLADQGKSLLEMSQLAIDIGLTSSLAGSSSNLDLARLVFRNIVGVEASNEVATVLASLIQGSGGSLSQAEFLTAAAQLELNQQHVNLVGLQATGVEYSI